MDKKGNEFKGLAGGAGYKRAAVIMGFTEKFYSKAVGNNISDKPIIVLDLGCGPGAMSYALAKKAHPKSTIIGIDISNDQLNYARTHSGLLPCKPQFINCSMDELQFPDNHFDIVMTSMALHETPPDVRRRAIIETARVMKHGGRFILVDWSKPKFGLFGVLWFPFLLSKSGRDNWNNIYKTLCENEGLMLEEDKYLNSVYRRQVFIKK